MSKKTKIISSIMIVLALIGVGVGGFYYWAGHHLTKVVPGKVYEYSSVFDGKSNSRVMYVAFQQGGNKAIVTQDRSIAVRSSESPTEFENAYKAQSATWEYSLTDTTLTLGKMENNQLSQWQYNKVFAYGDKFTSTNFYYQIAKGGQGEVNQKMLFREVK